MTIFQYFEANERARSSKITHTIMNVFAYVFALSSVPFFFLQKITTVMYTCLFPNIPARLSCFTAWISLTRNHVPTIKILAQQH